MALPVYDCCSLVYRSWLAPSHRLDSGDAVGALAAFGGVFASFVNITSLAEVIGYTKDDAAGRYLLPVLLAWFATMMTMFFADPSSSATTPKLKPVKPARGGRNRKR